eukprot:gene163-193_t
MKRGGLGDVQSDGNGDGCMALTGLSTDTPNSVFMTNVTFSGCRSSKHEGGALYLVGWYSYITDCSFTDVTSEFDGGAISTHLSIDINGCSFTSATSNRGAGGAIKSNIGGHGDFRIQNSTFSHCNAASGGAIYSISRLFIENKVMPGNYTCEDIESVVTDQKYIFISAFNSTDKPLFNCTSGSFLSISNPDTLNYVSVTNVVIDSTSGDGCIILESNWTRHGQLLLHGVDFYGCSATRPEYTTPGEGGAINTFGWSVSVTNSSFNNCSANNGGAIATNSVASIASSQFINCSSVGTGGAILATEASLHITGSTFSDCYSGSWGGVVYTTFAVTIYNSLFFRNSAFYNGGAIYATGSSAYVYIDHSIFNECSSAAGGAIFSGATSGSITATNSQFYDNWSDVSGGQGAGGAMYIDDGYDNILDFTNSIFVNNSAGHVAGAVRFPFMSNYGTQKGGQYINSSTASFESSISAFTQSVYEQYTRVDVYSPEDCSPENLYVAEYDRQGVYQTFCLSQNPPKQSFWPHISNLNAIFAIVFVVVIGIAALNGIFKVIKESRPDQKK